MKLFNIFIMQSLNIIFGIIIRLCIYRTLQNFIQLTFISGSGTMFQSEGNTYFYGNK